MLSTWEKAKWRGSGSIKAGHGPQLPSLGADGWAQEGDGEPGSLCQQPSRATPARVRAIVFCGPLRRAHGCPAQLCQKSAQALAAGQTARPLRGSHSGNRAANMEWALTGCQGLAESFTSNAPFWSPSAPGSGPAFQMS